jgi:heme-degrading monooxygenase HmoA
VIHFPGGTKAQYDAVRAAVAPDGMPDGEVHHVAGETDQGFLVSVVWESKDAYEAFFNGKVLPALGELGDKAFPKPPHISGFEVHNELHR